MILALKEFESFPARKVLRANRTNLDLDFESIRHLNEVEFTVDIQKSGDEYFCQAEAKASVQLTCARCLNDFDVDLVNTADFIICSQQWHEANRHTVDNEDYVFYQGPDLHADLREMVRQTIITSVSMKPLCSENCRGLCPRCGTNLNDASCSCRGKEIDQRWDGLRKLSGLT